MPKPELGENLGVSDICNRGSIAMGSTGGLTVPTEKVPPQSHKFDGSSLP